MSEMRDDEPEPDDGTPEVGTSLFEQEEGLMDPLRGLGSWKGPKDARGWPELG